MTENTKRIVSDMTGSITSFGLATTMGVGTYLAAYFLAYSKRPLSAVLTLIGGGVATGYVSTKVGKEVGEDVRTLLDSMQFEVDSEEETA